MASNRDWHQIDEIIISIGITHKFLSASDRDNFSQQLSYGIMYITLSVVFYYE